MGEFEIKSTSIYVPQIDIDEVLRLLKALFDEGKLPEEEFGQKKDQILGI